MATALVAGLALVVGFLPPASAAGREDAGAAELDRVCGWIQGPEALDPQVLEGLEAAAGAECRAVLRCLLAARRAVASAAATGSDAGAATPAEAEPVCDEILAWSPQDLRRFLGLLVEADAPPPAAADPGAAADPCAGLLRCLLEAREAGVAGEASQPADDPPPAGSWREEFARICGRTEEAASLPRPEIEKLIRESQALLERIAGLGIPEAKVYAFRLEKCRAFFEYALELVESRRDDGPAGGRQ